MSFNPDPRKPAEEILFSYEILGPYHPPLHFNNKGVKRVSKHKHLGLILNPKLSFLKHITEKIGIARLLTYLLNLANKFIKCMFDRT